MGRCSEDDLPGTSFLPAGSTSGSGCTAEDIRYGLRPRAVPSLLQGDKGPRVGSLYAAASKNSEVNRASA